MPAEPGPGVDSLARAVPADSRLVVLVEGPSDVAAVEHLATRMRLDLATERVVVIGMGGVTNLRRFLELLGRPGRGLAVAGLCDAGEQRIVERALDRTGYGPVTTRDELAALGFFVCDPDLEAEMIAAIGVTGVERLLAEQGELDSFRIFQRQPAQRQRPWHLQIQRFIGTRSGRKVRYGLLFAQALSVDAVPSPLAGLLAFVGSRNRCL